MTQEHLPKAWSDEATTIDGIADEFARAARELVARTTDVSAIGADQGNSTADDAVCLILPAAAAVLEEVIAGLQDGLKGEGQLMRFTGEGLQEAEDQNTEIARRMV